MLHAKQSRVTSRRGFLRNATLATAAVAAGPNLAEFAFAAEKLPADRVKLLELGVLPNMSCPGPTLVKLNRLTFLVFRAIQLDADGNEVDEGTAVIEFQGYSCGKFRYPGDTALAPHPLNLSQLDPCEVLEVENSTWTQRVQGPLVKSSSSKSDGKKKAKKSDHVSAAAVSAKPLRHFIFTFLGLRPGVGVGAVDFECLAENASGEFFTEPFSEILDELKFRDRVA